SLDVVPERARHARAAAGRSWAMSQESVSPWGVVVIARNEGERLRRCLASVSSGGAPLVYVDSGSTDGSVEVALGLSTEGVRLDLERPFTAARARNAGF